jgi:DNA polymerase-3 subunit epsilon
MVMNNFAAIDFETANYNRTSICSVGIVIVENGEIVDKFYSLVKPTPNWYSFWNTNVHGITAAYTENAEIFPAVWDKIKIKIEHLPLFAHNSSFDEGCLKAVFEYYEMYYPNYKFHCSCKLARKLIKKGDITNHQLHTVAAYYGHNLTNHHHALADAETCAIIALKLLSEQNTNY